MRKHLVKIFAGSGLVFILGNSILISILWFYSEVQRKQDLTNTMHNLRLIYTNMENYKEKNGYYPKQQSLRALLKTLNLSEKTFFKTRTIDISSAIYHAPIQNTETPFLTIEIKPTFFRRQYQRIVMQRDDVYYEVVRK